MADDRTRREKLEAMAADSGATEGERENARSLLDKMEPKASEPTVAYDNSFDYWDVVFAGLDDAIKINLHDQGILMAWDEHGICTICRQRH